MKLPSRILLVFGLFFGSYGVGLVGLVETASAFDVKKGEKVFSKCKACHTIDKGAPHRIGPNLWGILGKTAGRQERFRYSKAMREFGKKWDLELLDAYLAAPKKVIEKSRMTFIGLKKAEDRTNLIAYLNSKSDLPILLRGEKIEKEKLVAVEESGVEEFISEVLTKSKGRKEVRIFCTPCHSLKVVEQQGLTRESWDELLDWMVEEQGMEPLTTQNRALILNYLAKVISPERRLERLKQEMRNTSEPAQ